MHDNIYRTIMSSGQVNVNERVACTVRGASARIRNLQFAAQSSVEHAPSWDHVRLYQGNYQ